MLRRLSQLDQVLGTYRSCRFGDSCRQQRQAKEASTHPSFAEAFLLPFLSQARSLRSRHPIPSSLPNDDSTSDRPVLYSVFQFKSTDSIAQSGRVADQGRSIISSWTPETISQRRHVEPFWRDVHFGSSARRRGRGALPERSQALSTFVDGQPETYARRLLAHPHSSNADLPRLFAGRRQRAWHHHLQRRSKVQVS
jgi:hypothetical protein